jgi:hypothetical protein
MTFFPEDGTVDKETPNPGSEAAQEAGCLCPVVDNHYGKGVDGEFWMSADCPIHGIPTTNQETPEGEL